MTAKKAPASFEHETLVEAIEAVQQALPGYVKTATNSHYSSSYATLDTILPRVLDELSKHGVILIQMPNLVDGQPVLTCRFIHRKTREELVANAPLVVSENAKNPLHALGASITYMRRYSVVAAMAMLEGEDDDGNAAGNASTGNAEAVAASPLGTQREAAALLHDGNAAPQEPDFTGGAPWLS